MNLIDESVKHKDEKKGKTALKVILVAIVLIVLIIVGIAIYLVQLQATTLRAIVDGKENASFLSLLKFENDGTIYVPIKEAAKHLGYESFNGEYANKSEDANKCYVENEFEVANLTLESNKIYKLDKTKKSEYEYVYSSKPVKAFDGTLYASSEAIGKAFNVTFEYDKNANRIYVQTTPYLMQLYSPKVLDYGYASVSELASNNKTILKSNLVVKRATDNKYGVIDIDGKIVIDPKYDNIVYMEYSGDYLVTSNNKVGILGPKGNTKVQLIYDELQMMDMDAGLYIAKRDNKYGVIDGNENIRIYIENDELGVDITRFGQNEIKNKYLLADNLIPAKKDKFWALFDKEGNQLTEYKYDSFGYMATTTTRQALNLLVIPDYNVLVAAKDKKYTLINTSGKELFPTVADDIYMTINGGQRYYYIMVNDNPINAIDYMEQYGVNPRTTTNSSSQENNEENNQNSEEQQNADNQNNEEQQNQDNQENQDNGNN